MTIITNTQCEQTLRGVLQAIESQVPLFDTFIKGKSVLIEFMHTESVHRCSLGCSTFTYFGFLSMLTLNPP